MYTTLDWLDVCLPLAEAVETEYYQPTQAELEEYKNETEKRYDLN